MQRSTSASRHGTRTPLQTPRRQFLATPAAPAGARRPAASPPPCSTNPAAHTNRTVPYLRGVVDAQPDLAGPVVVQVGEGHLGGGEQGGREDKAGERVSGRVGDSLRTTHLLGRSSGSSSGGDGGGGGGSSSSSSRRQSHLVFRADGRADDELVDVVELVPVLR